MIYLVGARRADEMKQLDDALVPMPDRDMRRKFFVLHGLGGRGKTRLVLESTRKCQKTLSGCFFLARWVFSQRHITEHR